MTMPLAVPSVQRRPHLRPKWAPAKPAQNCPPKAELKLEMKLKLELN